MIYDNNFDDVLADADAIYQKHKETKGESWKDCNILFLVDKLSEELKEFEDIDSPMLITLSSDDPKKNKEGYIRKMEAYNKRRYEELLDIINVALMLAKRVK